MELSAEKTKKVQDVLVHIGEALDFPDGRDAFMAMCNVITSLIHHVGKMADSYPDTEARLLAKQIYQDSIIAALGNCSSVVKINESDMPKRKP